MRAISALPAEIFIAIIGGGISGILLARHVTYLWKNSIVLERCSSTGGVWYAHANGTSRVNTTEAAYRIAERGISTNTDHTPRTMIMGDVDFLT